MRWCTCLAFVCLILPRVGTVRADEPAPKAPPTATSQPSAKKQQVPTDLFLARSLGGHRYALTDALFVADAASPELVRLPKGGLLAVFDSMNRRTGRTTLFASRSGDNGRTWTPARPIRIHGESKSPGELRQALATARHADILRLPSGTLRMYFTVDGPDDKCMIRSATSVDGLNYKLDALPAATVEQRGDARPGIVRVGTRFHLFVTVADAAGSDSPARPPVVLHFRSRDGRKFVPDRAVDMAGGTPGAGFLAHSKGIRSVVALKGELRSVATRDGRKWSLEPDTLLANPNAQLATVCEMRDGTFLMAVEMTRPAGRRVTEVQALVAMSHATKEPTRQPIDNNDKASDHSDSTSDIDTPTDPEQTGVDAAHASMEVAEGWDRFASEEAMEESVVVDSDVPENDAWPDESAATPPDADTSPAANAEMDEQARAEQERLEKERADWLAVPDPVRPPIDSLPPLPDFTTPVNYAEWYARLCDINTPDNAYWAYDEFMPGPLNPDRQKEWPTLEIMYNRTDFTEPAPWDPEELEEWEASYQASLPLLQQFETASRHTGFARPVQFRPEDSIESPTGQPLLVGLLLPDLSAHRALVKQTLSANWRMGEDGKPNPDRMIEGWRTSLSSANHMHQGATLIEQLVGTAEQNLVESDARYALKHGVFKGEKLEQALNTLEQNDRDDFDAARSMQGEHAFVLDLMQAMFKAEKPGDLPRPAPEAIDKVVPLFGEDSKIIPEIKAMTPADVKKTLNAFETYYAEASNAMATGYPQVRTSDMDAMAKQHVDVSPMTRTLLPAFGRIQKIRARNEASRRATQLSYAVHIYKEQTGQWPQSLDDLPPRFSATMRTDPFTGGHFGYRVDASGPVIYSLSENGVDDGGQHSARWDDEKNGESDDHIFWPPQPK